MPTRKNKDITRIVNRVNKSSADFVNRLKDPNRLTIPDWEDSRYVATHKLGVGTDDNGQVFIYPSVQNINGKLVDFTNPKFGKWDGMDSAIERKDTVHVDSIQDGLDFTENYKRYYPKGKSFKLGGRIKAEIGTEKKDNTNVAPIYREQRFIPFKGAKKIMWDSLPKINGRRIASGAIDIVSPEFDLLTGIRGFTNMIKPKNYKSIISSNYYNPAISELDNFVNQGIEMGRAYFNHPIVKNTLEHNRQLYERIIGKPQNMIYIDKTGKKVLAKERGELLNNAVSKPINYKFDKLPKGEAGTYNRNADMNGNITIAEGLTPTITKNSAFHETLHHGAYGNYDGIIYDLKAEKLFPNNGYLRAGHEAAANTAEVGRDMGLAIGQKYPGMNAFKNMLDNLPKPYYKDVVIKSAKLETPRDYKRFWDALTGKYFTTAGTAATGLTLTNNDKMKYGGRKKALLGFENEVPTQEEYIAQQIAAKKAAALDKSRNRTSVRVPMVLNNKSEEEWRNEINLAISHAKRWIGHANAVGDTTDLKLYQDFLDKKIEELNKGYTGLTEGANCIYNAGDCYGLNIPGNQTFAAKHKEKGFKRIDSSNMEPGDIVQVVNYNKTPVHAMIFDSKDKNGKPLYNYAKGSHSGDFNRDYIKQGRYPMEYSPLVYRYVGTPTDSTQWINEYKQKYGNGMRCGGRRKAQLGLDIREGGIAIPIAPNMYYMDGRSHDDGGIAIGPNNKNGLEVEGGEVVKVGNNDIKVFSSVPLLRGVSPAQLVMGGANPNKVFKAQEDFKDKNRINDDGTTYEMGGDKTNNKIYDASGINKRKKIAKDVLQILPFSGFVNDVLDFINPISAGGALKSAAGYGATKTGLPFLSIPGIAFNGVVGLPDLIQDFQNLYKDIKTPKEEFNRKKKEFGGSMLYTINGNVKNGLMSARAKAQYGKTIKIDRDSYETVDEAVERYKQLYRIRYGKEPSDADVDRVAWTKTIETAFKGNPNLITGYGPNVGVRGPNVTKIVSGANKGKQIARTQTAVRNKNVKSATPQRQAINTKVNQAARNERLSQFERWQQGEAFKASTMPTDAVAVNRPNIGTGVRSGRKGRVDDVVAIERSQRGVDPLSSKSEFSIYDKAYAKKANNKMNQFTNALLASGTGGIIVGNMTYDDIVGDTIYNDKQSKEKQLNLYTNSKINKSVNPDTKVESDSSSTTKANNKNTNNDYISTTKPNTGESYVINPITGEWIRNGVTESSEPSIKSTTRVSSKPSLTPRGRGTNVAKTTTSNKPTTVEAKQPKLVERPKENLYITGIKNNAVKSPIMTGMEKISANPTSSSTGGETQPKGGRWVGQYKTTNVGDWIGLEANLAGTIGSYFMTKNAINKMPDPIKPVMTQAAKLKTRYNVEPQLTNIREAKQMNRAAVRHNTQSSNSSLAREQRLINEARGAKNQIYGQKENIETQLINQDRLNRQSVNMQNVRSYNEYLNRLTAAKTAQNQLKISNVNNLISGLTGSVNSILDNIESRRTTNNTIRAIAAANPNVDARLIGGFDYYIDPITKKKYNKNQQLVGTINR